jgi:hypothetical protein
MRTVDAKQPNDVLVCLVCERVNGVLSFRTGFFRLDKFRIKRDVQR